MSNNPIYRATAADMVAVREAFDTRAFGLMNVFANRMLSNVLYGQESDRQYVLAGFLLKGVALDLMQLDLKGDVNEFLDGAEKLLNSMENLFKETVSHEEIWNSYSVYVDTVRLAAASTPERQAYKKKDAELTRIAVNYLFTNVLPDVDALCHESGAVLESATGEIQRCIKCHGAELREVVLLSVLWAFRRMFEYHQYVATKSQPFDADKLKQTVTPGLNQLLGFFDGTKSDNFDLVRESAAIISEFVLEWRKLFIRYNEIVTGQAPRQNRIELPLAAKQQITESVRKALHSDLQDKEPKGHKKESKEK